jgi:nucleoside-diphosphate-sugar epimerase
MSYIRSDEAGKFIAFLVDKDYVGALNGCSNGTISIREILDYVEQKTGKKAIISKDGEDAPYNDEPEYSINTDRARNLGFQFTNLKNWIYELIDYYIAGEALCFKI